MCIVFKYLVVQLLCVKVCTGHAAGVVVCACTFTKKHC